MSEVADVRRIVTGLVLALGLAACGSAMPHMARDLNWEPCAAELWITGVIVPGTMGDAEIRDDQGATHGLVWGTHNSAVVDWGRRYRIGGRWFDPPDGTFAGTFWACAGADAVIPQ
jgi:hypothetical protein